MRPSSVPATFLPLLAVALSSSRSVEAAPFEFPDLGFAWLHARDGDGNCGSDLQFTCSDSESCATTINAAGSPIAFCTGAASPGGSGWGVFTTTFTETDFVVRTSTYTSEWGAATTPVQGTGTAQAAVCTASLGQQSCGVICCASDQACAGAGWCTAASTLYTYTGPATAPTTSGYSAPLRPTSGAATVPATTTQPFVAPATASGSTLPVVNHGSSGSHGLSGGAIAGIVIGVLAAIGLLILICFCCIVRAGFHGILSLLGLRNNDKKRKTERVETVERYSRHNSRHSGSGTASRRDTHSGWFGRSKPSRVEETRKKSSGWGGLGAVTAGLVGLAVILGLRRRSKKKEQEKRQRPVSDVSSSYYSYSYTGTSASK